MISVGWLVDAKSESYGDIGTLFPIGNSAINLRFHQKSETCRIYRDSRPMQFDRPPLSGPGAMLVQEMLKCLGFVVHLQR